MMVIRGHNAAAQGIPAASGTTYNIFPADRCTWQQTDNLDGGYNVNFVRFIGIAGTTTVSAIDVSNASLGFIGKSGRFVEIAK